MDCPFYINLGFLVGNAASLRLLQDISAPLRAEVRELLGNYYDAQVTLALAVAMRELPAVSLYQFGTISRMILSPTSITKAN